MHVNIDVSDITKGSKFTDLVRDTVDKCNIFGMGIDSHGITFAINDRNKLIAEYVVNDLNYKLDVQYTYLKYYLGGYDMPLIDNTLVEVYDTRGSEFRLSQEVSNIDVHISRIGYWKCEKYSSLDIYVDGVIKLSGHISRGINYLSHDKSKISIVSTREKLYGDEYIDKNIFIASVTGEKHNLECSMAERNICMDIMEHGGYRTIHDDLENKDMFQIILYSDTVKLLNYSNGRCVKYLISPEKFVDICRSDKRMNDMALGWTAQINEELLNNR